MPDPSDDPAAAAAARIGDILATAEREVAEIIAAAEQRATDDERARAAALEERAARIDLRHDEQEARERVLDARGRALRSRALDLDARADELAARQAELTEVAAALLAGALGTQVQARRLADLPALGAPVATPADVETSSPTEPVAPAGVSSWRAAQPSSARRRSDRPDDDTAPERSARRSFGDLPADPPLDADAPRPSTPAALRIVGSPDGDAVGGLVSGSAVDVGAASGITDDEGGATATTAERTTDEGATTGNHSEDDGGTAAFAARTTDDGATTRAFAQVAPDEGASADLSPDDDRREDLGPWTDEPVLPGPAAADDRPADLATAIAPPADDAPVIGEGASGSDATAGDGPGDGPEWRDVLPPDPSAGTERQKWRDVLLPRSAGPDAPAADGGPLAAAGSAGDDPDDDAPADSPDRIDSARLVALSMAAEGRSRTEVEAVVRDQLAIRDHEALLDYVFGISTPSSIVPSWPPRRRRRPS